MKLKIKPKELTGRTTVTQGFSITPQQKEKLVQLSEHFGVNLSTVVAQLIEHAHASTFKEKA